VAEDAGPRTGHRDEPRRLTEQGARRVRAAAVGLARLDLDLDLVASSPLPRCAETAVIVAERLGLPAPLLDDRLRPGMRLEDAAGLLDEHPDAASVLLCGHQPDLSLLVAELTGGAVELKKGALALIDARAPRPHAGVLLALHPPRTLRMLGA
jgi:phosphohistidine phosphatase